MDSAWKCKDCGFALFIPVKASALQVSHLGLYADARFFGRSILVYQNHVEHLDELSTNELELFWSDATMVGRVLRPLVGAARINYAVLGNAESHLHIHIIPRNPIVEPLPTRSPWSDTRRPVELDNGTQSRLTDQLSRALRR